MASRDKVIWSEGLFLQPQHFQQQDRYLHRLLEGRVGPVHGHGWGFASVEIDSAALAQGKLSLRAGKGILPDGTPFDFPDHDPPPVPLDIAADARNMVIVLAAPMVRTGMRESIGADEPAEATLARYVVEVTDVADSNSPADEKVPIETGRLRLTLMSQRDATDAYTTLGVLRVLERRPDNQVLVDRTYIRPVLDVKADPLLESYLRDLCGMLAQRGQVLAERLTHPGRGGVAEVAEFLMLECVNRFEPLMSHLDRLRDLHPERLYSTCLMLAGDLSTFSRTDRRPIAFAPYQHDALEKCFGPLIAELRRALSTVLEQSAIPLELIERGHGVRVSTITDRELLRSASFVLAVNAQLSPDVLRSRFPQQSKIGPVERLRELVNLALPGIPLRVLPVAPRQIPFHAGFNYFELEKDGDLWRQLVQSSGFGVYVTGDFPGLEMEFWAIKG